VYCVCVCVCVCVNVYCTTATGWQPNYSLTNISYHIISLTMPGAASPFLHVSLVCMLGIQACVWTVWKKLKLRASISSYWQRQFAVTAPPKNLPDFNNSTLSLLWSIETAPWGGGLITGCWKEYLDARKGKKLNELYSTPDTVRMIKQMGLRWARHVARVGPIRNECKILVVQPGKKIPLGITRRRWEDNIKLNV